MISYDKKINDLFYYWLLLSFLLIFFMVIVGGLTRLTDSGLSITEWELFKGIFPPLKQSVWNEYFVAYKQTTQFQQINFNMSLEQFKVIFYWEYFHRALGRLIGIFFLVPLIYFYFKSTINKKYIYVCFLVLSLILLQGVVGWYMVKSGLVNNITVSHYRLSAHLALAFIIISILFWIILNFKDKNYKAFFKNQKLNYLFYLLVLLIFVQIILGAFVSGLDAGKIYQTWPLMNYYYFPDDIRISSFNDLLDFNNHGLVQFYHRNIAYLIFIYLCFLGFIIFKNNFKKLYKPFYIVAFFLVLQIFLGIITLVSNLNLYLASTHQICGLLLMLSVINLYYNQLK